MTQALGRVIIGMDPHKASATIEVMDGQERVLGGGRFGTDEAGTAKAVLDATRPYNKIVRITGAILGDKAIDGDAVTRLAALPTREVLLAKLAGGMQAPVGTLAGLFAAPLRNLGYALSQVAEQKARADGA